MTLGRGWWTYFPFRAGFESEIPTMAGFPAVTLATVNDARRVVDTPADTVDRVRRLYNFRRRRVKVLSGHVEDEDGIQERSLLYQRLMHDIYAAQRAKLVRLRNEGRISAEVMRRLEHEIDLEESRLEV